MRDWNITDTGGGGVHAVNNSVIVYLSAMKVLEEIFMNF